MIADHPLESYVLELLKLIGRQDDAMENPPMGFARRAGAETSTFDVPAHKLLQALIEHSPSPKTMAREFLVELVRCEDLAVKELGSVPLPYAVVVSVIECLSKSTPWTVIALPVRLTGQLSCIKNLVKIMET